MANTMKEQLGSTDYFWYLVDCEGYSYDAAARKAGIKSNNNDYGYYDNEGNEDAYCGYDCDGYAIGG